MRTQSTTSYDKKMQKVLFGNMCGYAEDVIESIKRSGGERYLSCVKNETVLVCYSTDTVLNDSQTLVTLVDLLTKDQMYEIKNMLPDEIDLINPAVICKYLVAGYGEGKSTRNREENLLIDYVVSNYINENSKYLRVLKSNKRKRKISVLGLIHQKGRIYSNLFHKCAKRNVVETDLSSWIH